MTFVRVFRYSMFALFIIALFVFLHSLDSVCFSFDKTCERYIHFSLIRLIKGIFYAVFFLWSSHYIIQRVAVYSQQFKIHPSNRVLMINFFSVIIYIFAFFFFLQALKMDLTTFSFLSAAVVLGIGFGVQKILSNFISGVILLFDKSMQVGDLIQLDDKTFGYIRNTGTIYTLVEISDGKEMLIPNETFITSRITNWTHSSKLGRLEVKIGISYNADIRLAQRLLIEAAREHPLCSKQKEINCIIKEFGDSAIIFELSFWTDDITKGRNIFRSDVMFNMYKKLKDNNIEIPYPQQTVHLVK